MDARRSLWHRDDFRWNRTYYAVSVPDFYLALWVAVAVFAVELGVIAWIRKRYMDTPLLQAIFQVVLGGILVFLTGILIGNL